jgi:hypothetical protein
MQIETIDDGVNFGASNARDWIFQLIGCFKEMYDVFLFLWVSYRMWLKDFSQVTGKGVSLVDVATRPYTKWCSYRS